ncbi:MAG: SDR family NAD(P)-dependent oxidoreductase [Eubacteriales bacterium]|nr:SDR family NAD(P)-dependent oxidoreductase [Eubacteriales bacterium]
MNILITGANEGIGYYLLAELLGMGNNVTVLDVETGELLKLKEQYPDQILPIKCDVRDTDGVQDGVKKSVAAYGSIDIAVHNACRCTFQSAAETDYSVYEDVFNVNYFGALRLAKCVIPYMEKRGKGKVIFTSSGVGVMGFHNISPYASSKGAIETLAKCLNLEYADKGISFQIFHPPLTRTRSASPLPVPQDFLADPQTVGRGLARRINKKSYYICHSVSQHLQTRLCYLFPNKMGKMMSKLLRKNQKELQA